MLSGGVQRLARHRHRFGADQHECDHAVFAASVDPVVNGAALHQYVASLEIYDHTVIKLHVYRARDNDGIVDRIGAVIARDDARLITHDAEHGAIFDCGPERAGGGIMKTIVVDREALGRPDHAGGGAGPVRNNVLGDLVDLDFGAAVGGVSSDHTANLQAHREFLIDQCGLSCFRHV